MTRQVDMGELNVVLGLKPWGADSFYVWAKIGEIEYSRIVEGDEGEEVILAQMKCANDVFFRILGDKMAMEQVAQ